MKVTAQEKIDQIARSIVELLEMQGIRVEDPRTLWLDTSQAVEGIANNQILIGRMWRSEQKKS